MSTPTHYPPLPAECAGCKARIEQTPGAGRPRLYCKPQCGRNFRQRMRALFSF